MGKWPYLAAISQYPMQFLPKFIFACLVLLFVLLSPAFVRGQISYHHYLDSSYYWSEWQNAYYFGGSGTPCASGGNLITQRLFHVLGEEEINGEWWYAMHQDYQTTLYCSSGGNFPEAAVGDSAVKLWIREDSTGKIWGYQQGSPPIVLFDFGGPLAVGDTVWMNDYQSHCPIASIDSISIGLRRRARYHCACDTTMPPTVPSYVIEGAGLNESIFGFDDICTDIFDNTFGTSCIGFGQDVFVVDSTYACGSPGHVSVGIAKPQALNIDLRWNPDLHLVSFPSFFTQASPIHWQLFDINGSVLAFGEVTEPQFQLGPWSAGLYLLVLSDGRRTQVQKLPFR